MELGEVDIFGANGAQAVLDAGTDVCGSVDMRRAHGLTRHAATLGCQDEFTAPVRNGAADARFAGAVADRGVDEIDAAVEHGVQHPAGLDVGDFVGRWRAT